MEISNEIIKIIQSKVTYYKNKKYFKIFKDILISTAMKTIKNETISKYDDYKEVKINKNNKNKLKSLSINQYEKNSLWLNIMKNIFINKEIKDYDLKNNLIVRNEYNPYNLEKKEEDYCYVFPKNKKCQYQINNLVYLYLSHLSDIKIQRLNIISKKEKTPLTNIVRIYLGLCAQSLGLLKSKKKINEEDSNSANEKSSKKILLKKISLKNDYNDKKINTNKKDNYSKNNNNINNLSKFNNNMIQRKYISDIKTKLAQKMLILKNQSNKENNKNNKIILDKNKNDTNDNSNTSDNEEEKNKDDFNNDIISEEFIKSLNNLNKKNKNAALKILYSSSFTRLFIGETDNESIRERYLSNIDTKKEQKLEKHNKNYTLSGAYLKMFLNRISQDQKNNLPLIEKNMENLLNKFKKNQELIDRFKRINFDTEKFNKNEFNKKNGKSENIIQRINTTTKLEMRPNNAFKLNYNTDINININKSSNCLSLSQKKYTYYNNQIMKTPERKKHTINYNNNNNYVDKESIIINDKKKRNNLSYNQKKVNDNFRANRKKNIHKYNNISRRGNNKNILYKINLKNQIIKDKDKDKNKNTLLTERNHSTKKTHFQLIFEKKLFRNNDDNMSINNNTLGINKNLTTRGETNLYIKNEHIHNNKIKNFFTRSDFYFY